MPEIAETRAIGAAPLILAVDDDPDLLFLLDLALQGAGYRVITAASGEEAIEQAGKRAPALILLDVMMPAGGGIRVFQHLQGEDATREIPVIFLSALGESPARVLGLALGAVDYIAKPFDLDELLLRIAIAVRRLKRQRT